MFPRLAFKLYLILILSCVAIQCLRAEEQPAEASSPWLFTTIQLPKEPTAPRAETVLKGLVLKVGEHGEATICYDLDLCRFAAVWTGGFATPQTLLPRAHARSIGKWQLASPPIAGFQTDSIAPSSGNASTPISDAATAILSTEIADLKQRLHTNPSPQLERLLGAHERLLERWDAPENQGKISSWIDPRTEPYGPLPNVRYLGLHVTNGKALLSWSINGTVLLEIPEYTSTGETTAFTRHFQIPPTNKELLILLATGDLMEDMDTHEQEISPPFPRFTGRHDRYSLGGQFDGVKLDQCEEAIYARIPPCAAERNLSIQIIFGGDGTKIIPRPDPEKRPVPLDFTALLAGGLAKPAEIVATQGDVSAASDAYVVETIRLPNASMHPGGFDFFPDGRAALCTFEGDVFIISGLDQQLNHVVWQKFASGLNQPLGLKIVNDSIFVMCRDGLTCLKDLNGNGRADDYERVNNDLEITANLHEYVCDLQTDFEGNFYFTKGGPINSDGTGFDRIVSQHGTLMRLSPDGKNLRVVATGFRSPNGIGIGPEGELTCSDTMGAGTASRINWIQQGGYYSVPELSHWNPPPVGSEAPFCWLPDRVDNSPGGEVWVPPDARWGPWRGGLLHTSYGKCALFAVLKEEVTDSTKPACCTQQMQGGLVRFPLEFESGIMRARFNPADGQLYVAGLRGSQMTAHTDGCLQRVRYTGGPVRMPIRLHAKKGGLEIRFACALNREAAGDPTHWTIETDNGTSTDNQASPAGSSASKTLAIKNVSVATDDCTVFVAIPDLKPVGQMSIKYRIQSADGTALNGEITNTIHALGE